MPMMMLKSLDVFPIYDSWRLLLLPVVKLSSFLYQGVVVLFISLAMITLYVSRELSVIRNAQISF
jgi:hypothetical protein